MENRKKKIGIIGCGTIGAELVKAIEERFSAQAELVAVCDIDQHQAEQLKRLSSAKPQILPADELIKVCDLVIEAAEAAVSFEIAQKTLTLGKDVMIMSVGGILEKRVELFKLAEEKTAHIYIPSGAIAGIDAVQAAKVANISSATLVTRKPPEGLAGAPYIKEKKIDLAKIKEETVIFAGTAAEAIKGFPKNVNVSATLSLAGIGAAKTKVKIITSPSYKTNTHEIELEGDFGKLACRTENLPSPANPKTSYLASLSAIATLSNILSNVKIGT
ncbi:MAG: aspartate dehydrogenase [Candidatus Omnitrophica bacterium]|nr:aspartate dehydrogenase [Candidatus Omnitrophota bacterium]